MQIGPQDAAIDVAGGLKQVMVVVPVDAEEDSSTMMVMVMMMAITPSLNASSLPLVMDPGPAAFR